VSRALVTGAAGFIGSHVSESLLRAGWRVRGVDAFTDTYDPRQKRANAKALLAVPQFELVVADLCMCDFTDLLDDVDVVVHLAGEPGVSTSWGSGFPTYLQRNVLSTQRLLEAVSERRTGRFVYASSSSVYGPELGDVDESTVPRPISPYGVSKLAAERLVTAYAEQARVDAVSLRYFSVYGPRQRPDMAGHRFVEALLSSQPVTVYGSAAQARDFTYVDDVVAATVAALTAPVPSGSVLNVARGRPVSVAELLAELESILGVAGDMRREAPRRGDVPRTSGVNRRAREQLGWDPRTDLREGLERQVEWHLSRRNGVPAAPVPRARPSVALSAGG
jgi:UDP-glucuronate 4-epimerase